MPPHRYAAAVLAASMLVAGCTTSGDPAASPPAETPGATSEPTPPSPTGSEDEPSEQPTGNPELTRVLNEHLALFIAQAGFTPSGGDHDFLSGSNSVEMDGGTVVSVFIHPMERADLGDVSFEQTGTVEVGDTAVMLGRRSDGQAAARFDCGEFQFQFFGDDDSAVEEVAAALADEVFCPYDPTTPTQP